MDMNKQLQAGKAVVKKITCSEKQYPMLDRFMMGYIAVVLLFQILLQISPVMTFLATTPLYSIQTYLGLLGAGMVLVDLFTARRTWQGPYCLLLYGICVVAAVASLRMIGYGMKENLFKLCWAGIQFAIMYSCAHRMDRAQLRKYCRILYGVLVAIWLVACCVSLYQYAAQIGYSYVVNPLAKDSSATRQGFYDNRLFGIFYTLNHAAFISTMFLMLGIVLTCTVKKLWVKILLCLSNGILVCHVLLSGSRSGYIGMVACIAVLGFFLLWNRCSRKQWQRFAAGMGAALVLAGVAVAGLQGVKRALTRVPYLVAQWEQEAAREEQAEEAPEQTEEMPEESEETEELTEETEETEEITEETQTEPTETVEYDEAILHRENLEEDVSNGRLSIWKDYVSLWREVGPIGLSPGYYMSYIYENHPELYIVEYIRQIYPDKYESGIIYHVHSGYLMVYVSAGWIGTLLLLAFMALCVLRLIRKVAASGKVSWVLIGAALIVVAGCICAVFDEGLFFQNNPPTTFFWIALGVLMKECAPERTEKLEQKERSSENAS